MDVSVQYIAHQIFTMDLDLQNVLETSMKLFLDTCTNYECLLIHIAY